MENEQIDPKEWDEFCESVIIANAGKFTDEDLEYIAFAQGEIADHRSNWQYWS